MTITFTLGWWLLPVVVWTWVVWFSAVLAEDEWSGHFCLWLAVVLLMLAARFLL